MLLAKIVFRSSSKLGCDDIMAWLDAGTTAYAIYALFCVFAKLWGLLWSGVTNPFGTGSLKPATGPDWTTVTFGGWICVEAINGFYAICN